MWTALYKEANNGLCSRRRVGSHTRCYLLNQVRFFFLLYFRIEVYWLLSPQARLTLNELDAQRAPRSTRSTSLSSPHRGRLVALCRYTRCYLLNQVVPSEEGGVEERLAADQRRRLRGLRHASRQKKKTQEKVRGRVDMAKTKSFRHS